MKHVPRRECEMENWEREEITCQQIQNEVQKRRAEVKKCSMGRNSKCKSREVRVGLMSSGKQGSVVEAK